MEGMVFWPPLPPEFPKLLEPPFPQDSKFKDPPTHLDFHKIVKTP